MTVTYPRMRGETLEFELFDDDAAPGDEGKIVAKLAILEEGARTLVTGSAAVATLVITYRAATDQVPKGWTASLAAAACEALFGNRHYQLDSKRTDNGIVTASPPAIVYLREPAFA